MTRKLGALVAEKVMGWKRGQYSPTDDHPVWNHRNGRYVKDSSWSPSTDIAAAWEVVGALAKQELMIVVRAYLDKFGCEVSPNGQHNNAKWFGSGDSAPHAICLAALKAVGVSEDEIKEAMNG